MREEKGEGANMRPDGLYPFDVTFTCPKCGRVEVDVEYWEFIPARREYRQDIPANPEHLRCHCPRCGFIWDMACRDKEPEVPACGQ